MCNFYCKSSFLSYKNIYFVVASPRWVFFFTWLLFHQFILKIIFSFVIFSCILFIWMFIVGLQVELCGACFNCITDGHSWGSDCRSTAVLHVTILYLIRKLLRWQQFINDLSVCAINFFSGVPLVLHMSVCSEDFRVRERCSAVKRAGGLYFPTPTPGIE